MQLARITWNSLGGLRERASHIWIGGPNSEARCDSTSAKFSPACLRPVKKSAIFRPSRVDTIPEVNTPVRSDFSSTHSSVGPRAGIIARIFIVVSSLCTTSPYAACRISS
jgi:hypothetical protein